MGKVTYIVCVIIVVSSTQKGNPRKRLPYNSLSALKRAV